NEINVFAQYYAKEYSTLESPEQFNVSKKFYLQWVNHPDLKLDAIEYRQQIEMFKELAAENAGEDSLPKLYLDLALQLETRMQSATDSAVYREEIETWIVYYRDKYKLLKKPSDLENLQKLYSKLMEAAWQQIVDPDSLEDKQIIPNENLAASFWLRFAKSIESDLATDIPDPLRSMYDHYKPALEDSLFQAANLSLNLVVVEKSAEYFMRLYESTTNQASFEKGQILYDHYLKIFINYTQYAQSFFKTAERYNALAQLSRNQRSSDFYKQFSNTFKTYFDSRISKMGNLLNIFELLEIYDRLDLQNPKGAYKRLIEQACSQWKLVMDTCSLSLNALNVCINALKTGFEQSENRQTYTELYNWSVQKRNAIALHANDWFHIQEWAMFYTREFNANANIEYYHTAAELWLKLTESPYIDTISLPSLFAFKTEIEDTLFIGRKITNTYTKLVKSIALSYNQRFANGNWFDKLQVFDIMLNSMSYSSLQFNNNEESTHKKRQELVT
ncbi:MAG: hypothetical protein ABL870_13630, partial [Sediminibacterium sp.]